MEDQSLKSLNDRPLGLKMPHFDLGQKLTTCVQKQYQEHALGRMEKA